MDWPNVSEQVVIGLALGLSGWIGKKVEWLFSRTRQHEKDLNAAFGKIRELEERTKDGIQRNQGNP